MSVKDYNTNPDLNTTISGINIAEGCPPSGINNAIRQLMADVKADSEAQTAALSQTMTGATASTTGSAGLVPAPAAGRQDKPLRGDGTWADSLACNITGNAATATALYNAQGNPATLEDLLTAMKAYLPLSGGSMTGPIRFSQGRVLGLFDDVSGKGLMLNGSQNDAGYEYAASIVLYNQESAISPGHIACRARAGSQYSDLYLSPSGMLVKNGYSTITMPNFSAGVLKNSGVVYYAEKNGFLYVVYNTYSNSNDGVYEYLYINDSPFAIGGCAGSSGVASASSVIIPVSKGTKYNITFTRPQLSSLIFYPAGGE